MKLSIQAFIKDEKMTLRKILFVILFSSIILSACASPDQVGEPTQAYPSPGDEVTSPAYPGPDESSKAPWQPQEGDQRLDRAEAFVQTSEILTLESSPPQFMLHITGSLPTPCHQLRVEVSEPGAENRIQAEVYSLVQPDQVCIQVLEPFDVNVPLGSYAAGNYTVLINGEQIGEFTSP